MWPVNLISNIVCGALNAWGGYDFLPARRFIMPVILGVISSISCHSWWVGVLCLPACGTLCLGYFSGENWGRALWLFVQAIALGLGLTLFHFLSWWLFIPYCVLSGVLGGIYKNWYQPVGDFITGFYLSLFIWGITWPR